MMMVMRRLCGEWEEGGLKKGMDVYSLLWTMVFGYPLREWI